MTCIWSAKLKVLGRQRIFSRALVRGPRRGGASTLRRMSGSRPSSYARALVPKIARAELVIFQGITFRQAEPRRIMQTHNIRGGVGSLCHWICNAPQFKLYIYGNHGYNSSGASSSSPCDNHERNVSACACVPS